MPVDDELINSHILLMDHLNLRMVMDHARADPLFLAQLIVQIESKGVGERTGEESSFLEWARSIQRTQVRK